MVFKKMWGDSDNINRLSFIRSIILDISYEKLKDRIEIVDFDKKIITKMGKAKIWYNEKAIEIAKNMLAEDMDLEIISKITKLMKEKISSLSKD